MEDYICPITMALFFDPVVASDGFTYEREAINEWMSKNKKSPLTGEIMNSTVFTNKLILSKVKTLLEENPDLAKDQYFSTPSMNNMIINYNYSVFDKIDGFGIKINILTINEIHNEKWIKKCPKKFLCKLIDHSTNFNKIFKRMSFFALCCKKAPEKCVRKLCELGCNVNGKHYIGAWSILSIALRYNSSDVVKTLLEFGAKNEPVLGYKFSYTSSLGISYIDKYINAKTVIALGIIEETDIDKLKRLTENLKLIL